MIAEKMTVKIPALLKCAPLAAVGLLLAGCGSGRGHFDYQSSPGTTPAATSGSDKPVSWAIGDSAQVAVNAFLWRASLETLSFLPVASADPFGGIILTDWYAPPETPDTRFKLNVYLLSSTLRADGLKIAVFRQQRDDGGEWRDAGVGAEVASAFENAVIVRARDIRAKADARSK